MAETAVREALARCDFNGLCRASEELELEMCGREHSVDTAPYYAVHMLAAFGAGDLENARHLWRRAPAAVKGEGSPLVACWEVGRCLWVRDYGAAFTALRELPGKPVWGWAGDGGGGGGGGSPVAALVVAVERQLRARSMALMSKAFASISVAKAAPMLGLDSEQTVGACRELGWAVTSSNAGEGEGEGEVFIRPTTLFAADETGSSDAETGASGDGSLAGLAQLQQLCQYVTHLETSTEHMASS